MAVGRNDVICPLSAIAFGFRKPNDEYLRGAAVGLYCESEEAAAKLGAGNSNQERTAMYALRRWRAPRFEPHVVAVYANSAQVLRLVHASLYHRGGR
ncbi:MAG: DUF169 domain-containing protein, partial [Deltaproteobacteria bacterium]|nr:DUF169 domain-containing protein [Deltaproteobacteria bacterium]